MWLPARSAIDPKVRLTDARGPQARSVSEAGFSLIEMMVAITIGLGLLAGLTTVLNGASVNTRTNDRTSDLMTNGRYALNLLRQEVRQSGFRGFTWAEPTPSAGLGTLGNECLESGAPSGSFVANIRQGVWGANNSNPFSGTCIPAAAFASGSDVLVSRRLSPEATTALVADTLYFRSSYEKGQVFRGNSPPSFLGSPTPLADFALQVSAFYISPYTISAAESPRVPALYRVRLRADGTMAPEVVATGIERLQVQYGRLTTAPDTQYLDTLAGTSWDSAVTEWDDVNSVRIWLLARTLTAEPGYLNSNTYVMGDSSYTVNDGFRRQLFSTVIQLRN